VGQLVGGGGNLGLYEIKHARGKYANPPPKASRNRRFSWFHHLFIETRIAGEVSLRETSPTNKRVKITHPLRVETARVVREARTDWGEDQLKMDHQPILFKSFRNSKFE
jgi:hypothetical protein